MVYSFFRCPQLKTMSLKRSNMAQVVLNCPLLHELDIGSCHKLPDAAIRAAATSCPQLVSLDMRNCSCVSDETLREIAQHCPNLGFLDASYCPNISLEVCFKVYTCCICKILFWTGVSDFVWHCCFLFKSVRLPMLTILRLHSCEGITSASMAAIAHSSMLEVCFVPDINSRVLGWIHDDITGNAGFGAWQLWSIDFGVVGSSPFAKY
jgi:hypothetical protein